MNILPDARPPAHPSTLSVEDRLWREIQMMNAQGWTLVQRWENGANFQSVTKGGFPMWAHVMLLLFTVLLWLPVMIVIELFSSSGKHRWCRLVIDEYGRANYQEVDRQGNPL